MSYPFLSLQNIPLDANLVARIPAYLAYYHLVLPIAVEDDEITLVMAYPDNPKVVALFSELLGQKIVPVRGLQADIRAALHRVYEQQDRPQAQRFLNQGVPLAYMQEFAKPFQAVTEEIYPILLKPWQKAEANWNLISVALSNFTQARDLLRSVPISLLLTYNHYPRPQKILMSLQGHSPDLPALQMALELAGFYQAEIHLLAIAAPMKRHHIQGIATLLDASSKAGEHLHNCQQVIEATGIKGAVKVRQGLPTEQIAQEFSAGGYDLLVIAVETYGDFVFRVLEKIHQATPAAFAPILAVKPTR